MTKPAKTIPPKKAPASALALVDAARQATLIIRNMSYFEPEDARFDQEKIASLKGIFDGTDIPDQFIEELVERTQQAVIDLHAASAVKPRDLIARLRRLESAAKEFSGAWDDLGRDMRRALCLHLDGLFPTSKLNFDAQQAEPLASRMKRSRRDLPWIVQGASEFIDVLEANSAHRPHEYYCAWRIAEAWIDCTGGDPAETHERSSTRTPFQRFLSEAVSPLKIGDGVISTTIQALKLREKSS